MFDAIFLDVMEKEGVASIVTWNDKEPHVAATWNSYIHILDGGKLLIPVMGMQTTQNNIAANNRVKMVVGSKEVTGKFGPGAGFLLLGTARMIRDGDELAVMRQRFNWANCLMEVTVSQITQTV